jgi:hypothetical protein
MNSPGDNATLLRGPDRGRGAAGCDGSRLAIIYI